MGIGDTFGFDKQAYIDKIQKLDNSKSTERFLRKKHHAKVRSISTSGFSIGWGIGLAVTTAGVSLIGTVYSVRQVRVRGCKVNAIEAEMARREFPIPRVRSRDKFFGWTIGAVGAVVGEAISDMINLFTAEALPTPNDHWGQAMANPGDAVHGALDGAQNLLSGEGHHLHHLVDPDGGNAWVPQAPSDVAAQTGQHVGIVATEAAEKLAGSRLAQGATSYCLRDRL